jgi:uncharacterized protein (TIGR02217 family)
MAFHDVRFPEQISYGSRGGPTFLTDITAANSGDEQRNVNWSQSRSKYDVSWGLHSLDDIADLNAFFRARRGRAYAFRYKDFMDFTTNADGRTAPTHNDQILGTGDGTKTQFQLIKLYNDGAYSYTRTLTKPVSGTVKVAVNGTPVESGWSVNLLTGVITFDAPVTDTHVVTAGCEFDVPVRFDQDQLSVSIEQPEAGSMEIPLVEVRE